MEPCLLLTPQGDRSSDVPDYTKTLGAEVKRWRACHRKSDLFWIDKGTRLLIWDFRPVANEVLTVLEGHEKFSYMACDRIRTAPQVADLWKRYPAAGPLTEAEVSEALDSFTERGLMIRQGNSYLAWLTQNRWKKPAPFVDVKRVALSLAFLLRRTVGNYSRISITGSSPVMAVSSLLFTAIS